MRLLPLLFSSGADRLRTASNQPTRSDCRDHAYAILGFRIISSRTPQRPSSIPVTRYRRSPLAGGDSGCQSGGSGLLSRGPHRNTGNLVVALAVFMFGEWQSRCLGRPAGSAARCRVLILFCCQSSHLSCSFDFYSTTAAFDAVRLLGRTVRGLFGPLRLPVADWSVTSLFSYSYDGRPIRLHWGLSGRPSLRIGRRELLGCWRSILLTLLVAALRRYPFEDAIDPVPRALMPAAVGSG
jgi:hypothetical protein